MNSLGMGDIPPALPEPSAVLLVHPWPQSMAIDSCLVFYSRACTEAWGVCPMPRKSRRILGYGGRVMPPSCTPPCQGGGTPLLHHMFNS